MDGEVVVVAAATAAACLGPQRSTTLRLPFFFLPPSMTSCIEQELAGKELRGLVSALAPRPP